MSKKTALMVVHQPRSSTGDVGIKLRKRGYTLDVRRPVIGEKLPENMNEHDLAVIYGGPPSANDDLDYIKYEIDWISKVLESNKPFLGICLGAQMLAKNLGGSVQKSHDLTLEIGFLTSIPQEMVTRCSKVRKSFSNGTEKVLQFPSHAKFLLKAIFLESRHFDIKML